MTEKECADLLLKEGVAELEIVFSESGWSEENEFSLTRICFDGPERCSTGKCYGVDELTKRIKEFDPHSTRPIGEFVVPSCENGVESITCQLGLVDAVWKTEGPPGSVGLESIDKILWLVWIAALREYEKRKE